MRTMRLATIPLSILLLAALATPAAASNFASKASLLFLQGQDVEAAYDRAETPARDIRVEVWHDREDDDPYRRGESMNVHFSTNADLYVVIYRIDAEGEVEILWPTSRMDDGFVYGNHTYSLPRQGSSIRLTASQVKGVEYVQAIASEYPFDLRQLGIDFRFDQDDRGEFRYAVSGDPFLAVNDINYAITGLEEDAEYIVTDWTHLYVDSKVDYARYTCRQCHDGNDADDYHPYVDTCTTVNVYNDWGWHRRWYVSFGWYPLYYEPGYYYWDLYNYRPYWYSYYPVVYRWPVYPVYARPYALYGWYNSPYYTGDYRVRYKNGRTRYAPLYDIDGPSTRRHIRTADARSRDGRDLPRSVRDAVRRDGRDPRAVDRSALVRDRSLPTRTRGNLSPATRGGTRRGDDSRIASGTRAGIRTDVRRNEGQRIRSLQPVEDGRSRGGAGDRSAIGSDRRGRTSSTERRWTRPVIRNVDPQRDRGSVGRGTSDRREGGNVDRSGSSGRTRREGGNVDRSGSSGKSRGEGGSVNRSGSSGKSRGEGGKVDRSGSSGKSRGEGGKVDRSGSSGKSRGEGGNVNRSGSSGKSRGEGGNVNRSSSSGTSRRQSSNVTRSRSSGASRRDAGKVGRSSNSSSRPRGSATVAPRKSQSSNKSRGRATVAPRKSPSSSKSRGSATVAPRKSQSSSKSRGSATVAPRKSQSSSKSRGSSGNVQRSSRGSSGSRSSATTSRGSSRGGSSGRSGRGGGG